LPAGPAQHCTLKTKQRIEEFQDLMESLILAQDERWRRA
jgi:hypothetical protein